MLWFSSLGVRKFAKDDIRKIYYLLLIVFVVWGSLFVNITIPIVIFAVSANIANFTMALSAILTIRLNRKVLPKEFRPAAWREVMLVLNLIFFGFFFGIFLLNRFFDLKF